MKKLVFIFLVSVAILSIQSNECRAETLDTSLKRLEVYALKGMVDWKIPGMAISVVKGDKVVYAKGFGTKRIGTHQQVDPDTLFQVGSTTKAFTSALVGQLVDKGEIGWDDHVVDIFPEFMMSDPWVTRECRVHDLFAQHSGMASYAGDEQSLIGFDRDHIMHSIRYIPQTYGFRDRFTYVNNLFLVGARVAEIKTGNTWETLMQEKILTPLTMNNSSVTMAAYANNPNKATLHVLAKGTPTAIEPGSLPFDWPYVYGPAGGLNSSANDMAKWLTAQMNDGKYGKTSILSPETTARLHASVTPVDFGGQAGAYCLGWMRTEMEKTVIVWHNGNTSGAKSIVAFSPKLGVGIVVLTNLGNSRLPDALAFQLFDMLSGVKNTNWPAEFLQNAKHEEPEETAKPVMPGLPLKAYAGKYTSPIYGDMTVSAYADHLVIGIGSAQQISLTVTHSTYTTFSGDWSEFSPDDTEFTFEFVLNGEGSVTGVVVPDFDGGGIGTFTRQ